ncbi:MAG: 50S ribosomal protein L3 [Firmicutes bacterium]|nr:50S ribosomal protein L3 [Bacillota bacterium]
MEKAILGKKLGMTQVFTSNGGVVAVTVVEAGPCVVTGIKTQEKDGYSAVVVGFGDIRKTLVNKPEAGAFKKAGVAPMRDLKELKLDNAESFKLGDTIKCDTFTVGEFVDVTSKTKGRGTTGTIQRWNYARGRMTHGGGPVHRAGGSLGANSTPSRVLPGKKMAGVYGGETVSIQNLEIIKVDTARNCLLIKGAIPGGKGSLVTVKSAIKAPKKK